MLTIEGGRVNTVGGSVNTLQFKEGGLKVVYITMC